MLVINLSAFLQMIFLIFFSSSVFLNLKISSSKNLIKLGGTNYLTIAIDTKPSKNIIQNPFNSPIRL